jgi:hypothetical protein
VTGLPHFLEVWLLTTRALRTGRDFHQVVVDYAAEAASHGAEPSSVAHRQRLLPGG